MNLWEHGKQILQEIYCIVRHDHQGAESFAPASEVVELVQYYDIRNDHTCSVHEVTNEPESNVFSICLCLPRMYQEIEATYIDQKSMPESISIPFQKL